MLMNGITAKVFPAYSESKSQIYKVLVFSVLATGLVGGCIRLFWQKTTLRHKGNEDSELVSKVTQGGKFKGCLGPVGMGTAC